MSKKKKTNKRSNILYWIAGIVILIPCILLAYIYFGAKENSGKPTVGSRFDHSLNPAITDDQLSKLKSTLKFDGVDQIEINLISATLRVNIDTKDDASADTVKSIMNEAYDDIDKVLPIKTYFTNNKDNDKMYDVEVHVYNYIPDDSHPADDQIYMVKTKTAAAKKPNVSTPSSPKNKKLADKLLKEQEQAKKDAEKAAEGNE